MKFGWQRGWGGNRRSLPYLVFVLSLTATICAWVWAGLIVATQDADRFRSATEEAEEAIKSRLDDQEALVRAGAATFALQRGWTRAQFQSYVDNLDLSVSYKGSQNLGFIRRTPRKDIPQLEKKIRSEGESGFTVHPNPAASEAYPIVYLEPADPNGPSIGFDAASDETRRAAMDEAEIQGQVAMSGVVASSSAKRRRRTQARFLLFYPIYDGGEIPDVVQDRKKRLIGFVFSRFDSGDVFHDVLEGEARKNLYIEIVDVQKDSQSKPFYVTPHPRVDRVPSIHTAGYIPVAGRQWKINYYSSPGFDQQSAGWLVNWIPIVGLLVSTLLAAVSFSQVRAYRQLNDQAAIVVRREAHQRLLANVGASLVDSDTAEENLRSVCRLVVEQFADWFAVCLWEREESPAISVSALSMACRPRLEALADIEGGVLDWAVQWTSPASLELDGNSDIRLKSLREGKIHSIAAVPILDRRGPAGAVIAWCEDVKFDDDDMRLLEQIASRTSVAIDSDRLFEEKERELEERRKAEAQIRRLNENLELLVEERTTELQATNQELEAFCYSVSHDLRAPLRSVDGFSKSLLEDYGDRLDDQAKDYIGRVRNASQRMDELITALLNLSRITRLEIVRHPIDMSQMAQLTVEDALENQNGKHYTVSIRPNMVADADPKLLRVLLDNLVRNAIKFSAPSKEPRIEIGIAEGAFFVRDNGVGFNPAYADKLFVAFERLHTQREFPGSGIGLATVQRIVQKHGGLVWAESQEGHGATFYFTLR